MTPLVALQTGSITFGVIGAADWVKVAYRLATVMCRLSRKYGSFNLLEV